MRIRQRHGFGYGSGTETLKSSPHENTACGAPPSIRVPFNALQIRAISRGILVGHALNARAHPSLPGEGPTAPNARKCPRGQFLPISGDLTRCSTQEGV